ncbi:hypothetical protein LguiB_017897 [Lonicera macranthoides]
MMNSNPKIVSTDYDTSDHPYFEPLTVEVVLNIIDLEQPDGIIQYLEEKKPQSASGGYMRIWGTSPDSIDAAEDREVFDAILKELEIEQPKGGIAKSKADALVIESEIGAMEIVYNDDWLVIYIKTAIKVDPDHSVLGDKYLIDAIEIDIDALADLNGDVVIGGIIEQGVHSGDSACMIPTQTISASCLDLIRTLTKKLAKRLNVCGLMNCQYAITVSRDVYLLQANTPASSIVPFVSKAIGQPLAKYASLVVLASP